eukprot:scaffold21328_cov57-Phaeocystis_antarctica.AAC.3
MQQRVRRDGRGRAAGTWLGIGSGSWLGLGTESGSGSGSGLGARISLFGGASSEVRRCNCSVVDESCSSLAGLDARCVSFYRAIYLSIYLSKYLSRTP